MATTKRSYLEHVAVRVKDIDWYIRFFRQVLGMDLREVDGPVDSPRQVWTVGGMQLIADADFDISAGRVTQQLAHLGIMTENLEEALREAQAWGAKELPKGRNWLALPDGLVLELIQAHADSVAEALAVKPRA